VTNLTTHDHIDLARHEKIIARGLQTFRDVGEALAQIRDDKLYVQYGTFVLYCQTRWDFSIRTAEHLINAASVVAYLADANNCSPLPANEAQARPLTTLRDETGVIDLELVGEVWRQALDDGDGGEVPPTAVIVEETVRQWKLKAAELKAPEEAVQPVDDEPASEEDADDTPPPCPNCGCTDVDEDGDCAKCHEPKVRGDADEGEAPTKPVNTTFEVLEAIVDQWRDQYDVTSDSVAAAMLENLATKIREG